jgi:hypothetical protein
MILVKPHDEGAAVGNGSSAAGPFPKPRAFPDQRREYTLGFENAFEARGDARPPCQEFLGLLRFTSMGSH